MKRILVLVLIASLLMASPAFADAIKIVTKLGKTYEVATLRFAERGGEIWELKLTNGRDLALRSSEIKAIVLSPADHLALAEKSSLIIDETTLPSKLSPEELQVLMQQSQAQSLKAIAENTKTIMIIYAAWSAVVLLVLFIAVTSEHSAF